MVRLLLLVAPPLPVIVSVTVKVPELLYVCEGFCAELWAEPSPKFQSQAVIVPLDSSVNCTNNGAWPEVGLAVKFAVGGGGGAVAVTAALLLVLPPPPVIVSVTVKVPALLYVCEGFCAELWAEPSPKFQSQLVMLPVDWSVNWTINGACPDEGCSAKLATGGGGGGAETKTFALLLLVAP